jgi:hypothetical protein
MQAGKFLIHNFSVSQPRTSSAAYARKEFQTQGTLIGGTVE